MCDLTHCMYLVCACLKSSASSLALIWLWFLVLRVTSHPNQQNLLCRSLFSFCFFCGSSISNLELAKPTVSPETPALIEDSAKQGSFPNVLPRQ